MLFALRHPWRDESRRSDASPINHRTGADMCCCGGGSTIVHINHERDAISEHLIVRGGPFSHHAQHVVSTDNRFYTSTARDRYAARPVILGSVKNCEELSKPGYTIDCFFNCTLGKVIFQR